MIVKDDPSFVVKTANQHLPILKNSLKNLGYQKCPLKRNGLLARRPLYRDALLGSLPVTICNHE